jgi:mRNA interferase RelE/StbE
VANYAVRLAATAEKELNRLPSSVIARIVRRIEALGISPRPVGSKKLAGGDNEWRIRVGDYRVIYEIHDDTRMVDVTRIAHRRDVYRHR